MADGFQSWIRECVETALGEGRPRVDEIVQRARAERPDLFRDHAERLADMAAGRIAKSVMRQLTDDDETRAHPLPGFEFPSVIAVGNEGGEVYYVRSDNANWDEVLAGKATREANVLHAEKRLSSYIEAMDQLRPLMANDSTLTVGEALRRIRVSHPDAA